jgi:hypothetical protein
MSFDFASLKQPQSSSPTSLSPPQMPRSHSLKKGSIGRAPAVTDDTMSDFQAPRSERQRALNVKRARKMARVRLSLYVRALV